MGLKDADLRIINTATKYPEIPTHHVLGDRGRLTDELNVMFEDTVILSEKVDGTGVRVIKDATGDWIIGSREDLLTAKGDRVANKFEGVIEAIGDLPEKLPTPFQGVRVYFMEAYGGRIGGQAKQYSKNGAIGFRIFDAATIPLRDFKHWNLEQVSSWRKRGGQEWFSWDDVQTLTGGLEGVEMAPEIAHCQAGDLPADHQGMLDLLERMASKTRCGLTEQGNAEGIVLRSLDRKQITKARFVDYRRTLGIK